MKDGTPSGVPASRFAGILNTLDYWIFERPDADATLRGWEVRRDRRFRRRYRDPRWDEISACARCSGSGTVGAALCPACDGAGTLRALPRCGGAPR